MLAVAKNRVLEEESQPNSPISSLFVLEEEVDVGVRCVVRR